MKNLNLEFISCYKDELCYRVDYLGNNAHFFHKQYDSNVKPFFVEITNLKIIGFFLILSVGMKNFSHEDWVKTVSLHCPQYLYLIKNIEPYRLYLFEADII